MEMRFSSSKRSCCFTERGLAARVTPRTPRRMMGSVAKMTRERGTEVIKVREKLNRIIMGVSMAVRSSTFTNI